MFIVVTGNVEQHATVAEAEEAAERAAKQLGSQCVVAQVIGKVSAEPTAFEVRKHDKDGKPVEVIAADVTLETAEVQR